MADASPSGDWTINQEVFLVKKKLAGTVVQYDGVRLDSAGEAVLCDANDSNDLYGMALQGGVDDEWVLIAIDGANLTISSGGFTPDSHYYISETSGKFAPLADITTGGAHKTRAFWAHSATNITIDIFKTGDTA